MPFPTKLCTLPGRGSHGRIYAALALGLLVVLARGEARADWEIGASAGAFYDDNLTRAQDAVDKRAAGAITASVTGTNFISLTGSDGVAFTLYGRAELFDRYNGLTNLVAGAAAAYRHDRLRRLPGRFLRCIFDFMRRLLHLFKRVPLTDFFPDHLS
jgi:hypothetical protein